MKVMSTSPISISKVKEVLEARAEAGEELGYEQANALEHAKEFSKLDSKKVHSLASKLKKASPMLTEDAAVKMADLQPSTPALVKAIALQSKVELKEEDVETILKTIKG